MAIDLRNPYVILGLDYGASVREARRAMARRTRMLREHPDAMYSTEDLTWALHQVEQVNKDPHAGVNIFRLPANPHLFKLDERPGLFNPQPRPLPRRTTDPNQEELDLLEAIAVEELAKAVFALDATTLVTAGY